MGFHTLRPLKQNSNIFIVKKKFCKTQWKNRFANTLIKKMQEEGERGESERETNKPMRILS